MRQYWSTLSYNRWWVRRKKKSSECYNYTCHTDAESKMKMLKAMSLYGCLPVIFLMAGVILNKAHEEWERPRPEYIPYDYMYRRTKVISSARFPSTIDSCAHVRTCAVYIGTRERTRGQQVQIAKNLWLYLIPPLALASWLFNYPVKGLIFQPCCFLKYFFIATTWRYNALLVS